MAAASWSAAEVVQKIDAAALFPYSGQGEPGTATDMLAKLVAHGCVRGTPDGRFDVLNLGALLFARELGAFEAISRKALRVVFYRGVDRRAASEELPLGDRGYALVLDALFDALRLRLPVDEVVRGAKRERREHFPELALRELIVNALVHQDFAVRGAGPMVEVFSDRVEVINPGRSLVDLRRLIDWPAQSRNESLARLMRLLRLCEERGSGIDRVVGLAEYDFLPAPDFEVLPGQGDGADFMRVRLLGPRPYARMTTGDRLRAVDQHACLLYARGERLTNSSLRARLGLDDSFGSQVSRLIKQAREANLIVPADDGERTYVPAWAVPSGAVS